MTWRPIETIPDELLQSGAPVIVAVPCARARKKWLIGEAYYNAGEYAMSWWWAGTTNGDYRASSINEDEGAPTHWQPLPAPPDAARSTEEGE